MTAPKDDRHAAIRAVIRARPVSTQADLRKALRARGMKVDQSTLSRDLIEIGIRKAGGRYVLNGAHAPRSREPEYAASVISFMPCGPHLVVVRTTLGAAQPLAVKLDQAAEPAIAATLAGDDTIFIATRNRRSQTVALRRLEQWFGEKHER